MRLELSSVEREYRIILVDHSRIDGWSNVNVWISIGRAIV